MPKQTKYARVGERVRLVTVKRFIRCGYPLDRDIVLEKFADEIEQLRIKTVNAIIGEFPVHLAWNNTPTLGVYPDQKLVNAIASYILQREGFGGKERKVYEDDRAENAYGQSVWLVKPGDVGKVTERKIVYTGEYYPPSSGYSWEGEYDWEPGGIYDPKAHCVYTLEFDQTEFSTLAENCERVQNLDKTGGEDDSKGNGGETDGHGISCSDFQEHSEAG